MKNIKFRVWNKLQQRFCLDTEDGYFGQEEDFPNGVFIIGSWNNDDVIQQYIGLKDKNGKEIYEGDIIHYLEKMDEHEKAQENTATVYYDEEFGAWGMGQNYFLDRTVVKTSIEVIGNIFEGKNE